MIQKSIGRSPAEIIFGKRICREQWITEKQEQQSKTKETEMQGETATRRSFNVGEVVLVKMETRTKDKDMYVGPYEIVQNIHERRYLLVDKSGKTIERNVEVILTKIEFILKLFII